MPEKSMKVNNLKLLQTLQSYTCDKRKVEKGDFIHHQGQAFRQLYLVELGKVHFSYATPDGRQFLIGNIECDNHLFGEVEYFSDIDSQWNIIASEDIEISIIKAKHLADKLKATPSLYLPFIQEISRDLCEQNTIFLTRLMNPLRFNILNDIYSRHIHGLQVLPYDSASQEAERFGTSYRVYRRVIKELIEEGLLTYKDQKLEINDFQRVREYLKI